MLIILTYSPSTCTETRRWTSKTESVRPRELVYPPSFLAALAYPIPRNDEGNSTDSLLSSRSLLRSANALPDQTDGRQPPPKPLRVPRQGDVAFNVRAACTVVRLSVLPRQSRPLCMYDSTGLTVACRECQVHTDHAPCPGSIKMTGVPEQGIDTRFACRDMRGVASRRRHIFHIPFTMLSPRTQVVP